MGGSLYKWYQDEALMEGKEITTSILPLAIDLKEIERWRSKEQCKLKRTLGLGWDSFFLRKLQEEEEEKGLLLI